MRYRFVLQRDGDLIFTRGPGYSGASVGSIWRYNDGEYSGFDFVGDGPVLKGPIKSEVRAQLEKQIIASMKDAIESYESAPLHPQGDSERG